MLPKKMFASGVTIGDVVIDELTLAEVTVGRREETQVSGNRYSVKLFDTSGRLIDKYDSTEYVTVRRASTPATI